MREDILRQSNRVLRVALSYAKWADEHRDAAGRVIPNNGHKARREKLIVAAKELRRLQQEARDDG